MNDLARCLDAFDHEGCRREFEAALASMLSKNEAEQPFVVLEHAPSRQFVQFCGSRSRRLLLDVPALSNFQHEYADAAPETLTYAVAQAWEILRHLVGRVDAATLRGDLEPRDLFLTEHPDPRQSLGS